MSAVLMDGRGRNPTETTHHRLGSASEEAYVGYLDLVPEVDCGMHGRQGWHDRLDKEKANENQSFLRLVPDDGKNIVVQVAAAMSGLHNHLRDMSPLLLEGVSSYHRDHRTRKTAEQKPDTSAHVSRTCTSWQWTRHLLLLHVPQLKAKSVL